MGKIFQQAFNDEDIKLASKYTKRYSVSLVTGKCKLKPKWTIW